MEKPLTEKLRPSTLSEVVGQEMNITVLKGLVAKFKDNTFQFPNLFFFGPPGTGKTSTARAFVNEILGPKRYGCMELNASDDRKIEVVRTRIKEFCSSMPMNSINIVILDEAEKMTSDAQTALKAVIEEHNGTTRFIIISNEPEGVIEPIRSRCSPMFFGKLSEELMESYIRRVAVDEKINIEDDAYKDIVLAVDGKPRDALNFLSQLVTIPLVTRDVVKKISKDSSTIQWDAIYRGLSTNPMTTDKKVVELMEKDGIDAREIVYQLLAKLLDDSEIPEKVKPALISKIAEYDFRLALRGTPRIQIRCMVWSFYHAIKNAKKVEG